MPTLVWACQSLAKHAHASVGMAPLRGLERIMTERDTDLLAELVRGKLECLSRLRDMGHRQLEFVSGDQTTELLDVLAAKQQVLLRLQQIERQLAPYRDQEPNARRWRTPEQRQLCARQLEACEVLLREIVAQEKNAEQELMRRRDDLATRLQGMHVADRARGAYQAETQPPARRIDLSSES